MSATAAKRDRDLELEPQFRAPPPRPRGAHVIRDDAEAIAAAREAAAEIAGDAVLRDRERVLPYRELDLISDAGLLAITVPKEFGGAGVRSGTVAEVIAQLASADGSIGQIPQNHFFMLEALRLQGTQEQKRFFYGRILSGERIGNALSESGGRTAHDHATRLYSIGALFAHRVAVVANDEDAVSAIAFVPRDAAGIAIVDDWFGFGQRVTGSGTTILDDVEVHEAARMEPVSDVDELMVALRCAFDLVVPFRGGRAAERPNVRSPESSGDEAAAAIVTG